MSKILSTFLFCAFALMFSSCEKDTQTLVPVDVAPNLNQSVVFQYALHNFNTKTVSGWLITGFGEVRSYELSFEDYPANRTILESDELTTLRRMATENGKKVDFTELENHFKTLKAIDTDNISDPIMDGNMEYSASFIAYRTHISGEIGDVTNASSTSSDTDDYSCNSDRRDENSMLYERIILEEQGSQNSILESIEAAAVVRWLKGLEGSF